MILIVFVALLLFGGEKLPELHVAWVRVSVILKTRQKG